MTAVPSDRAAIDPTQRDRHIQMIEEGHQHHDRSRHVGVPPDRLIPTGKGEIRPLPHFCTKVLGRSCRNTCSVTGTWQRVGNHGKGQPSRGRARAPNTAIVRCQLSASGLLEGVELKLIDLQLGCAYMHVYSKRGRTLSSRSSLKKMEDIIHE